MLQKKGPQDDFGPEEQLDVLELAIQNLLIERDGDWYMWFVKASTVEMCTKPVAMKSWYLVVRGGGISIDPLRVLDCVQELFRDAERKEALC